MPIVDQSLRIVHNFAFFVVDLVCTGKTITLHYRLRPIKRAIRQTITLTGSAVFQDSTFNPTMRATLSQEHWII